MSKIPEIRFLVPPALFLFSLFLFSPDNFIGFFDDKGITGLLIGTTGLLASGFLISSISEFIVNLLGLRVGKPKFYLKASATQKANETEFKFWNDLGEKPIAEQIHKRWNMAMTNFNCVVALLFSIFAAFYIVSPSSNVLLFVIGESIFVTLFILNGYDAWRSVRQYTKTL